MAEVIEIGARRVGSGEPVFVIAELSANHHHDIAVARELIELAADAGADAVKLQTYTADSMTLDLARPPFTIGPGSPWEGRTLYDLYQEAFTPWEWYEELDRCAAERGMLLFSTPFDAEAVDFLERYDSPVYKIASFELVDLALVAKAAATGRPLIMSTGMATEAEIDDAVNTARTAGSGGLALLRCNSAYPSDPSEMDLSTIADMRARWDVPIGLSDHTMGLTAVTVAVSLGACIVEKHLVRSRSEPGPDSSFSLEPEEFASMVRTVREVEATLGATRYGPSPSEASSLAFRRSLFVVADVAAGEPLTNRNVRAIRPAGGLAPKHLDEVLGRHAAVDITAGTPVDWDLLS